MDNGERAGRAAEAVDQAVVWPAEMMEEAVPDGDLDVLPVADVVPPEPAPPAFVYALGRVEPRFPSMAVEKEFAQILGRADTDGLTDRQALQSVISERHNRYLARQLCWVFSIEGLETYILGPRDPMDVELLIEAVRADPRRDDVDVVIGQLGPLAPPEICNGPPSPSSRSISCTRLIATHC